MSFFNFLPWLYILLAPAVAMRLWAEELKSGSIELLLTQPITLWQAVVGKLLAAWLFVGIALVLTFPTWITVNYLGNPDNGAALAAYIGAFVMAGAYPRRRLVHVGDDQERGDCLRRGRLRLPAVRDRGISGRDRMVARAVRPGSRPGHSGAKAPAVACIPSAPW